MPERQRATAWFAALNLGATFRVVFTPEGYMGPDALFSLLGAPSDKYFSVQNASRCIDKNGNMTLDKSVAKILACHAAGVLVVFHVFKCVAGKEELFRTLVLSPDKSHLVQTARFSAGSIPGGSFMSGTFGVDNMWASVFNQPNVTNFAPDAIGTVALTAFLKECAKGKHGVKVNSGAFAFDLALLGEKNQVEQAGIHRFAWDASTKTRMVVTNTAEQGKTDIYIVEVVKESGAAAGTLRSADPSLSGLLVLSDISSTKLLLTSRPGSHGLLLVRGDVPAGRRMALEVSLAGITLRNPGVDFVIQVHRVQAKSASDGRIALNTSSTSIDRRMTSNSVEQLLATCVNGQPVHLVIPLREMSGVVAAASPLLTAVRLVSDGLSLAPLRHHASCTVLDFSSRAGTAAARVALPIVLSRGFVPLLSVLPVVTLQDRQEAARAARAAAMANARARRW